MRRRIVTRAVVLALLGLLAFGGTAYGQSEDESDAEGVEISHESELCIEILESGGEVDDCHEAPNLILPETNEIIWGALSFAVLFILLAKLGFPAIQKGMADRTERIREDVEAAERIREEASAEESSRGEALKEARREAAVLVEAARKEADTYRTAEREQIDAEMVELREQGQLDVESSKQQALSELRGEVATLAIGAAEQVVGHSLDRAANERLVEEFIDSVGAGNGSG